MTRRGVRPARPSLLNQALTLALVVGVLFLVAWPMVFLPFGSLPYLQRFGFFERAAIFGAGFVLAALSIWVTTTPQHRAMIRRTHRADEHTGLRLACLVLLLVMAAAWLSRNSLGSLAYLVQGEPYVESFTVVDVDRIKREVLVDLKSQVDGSAANISLSGRLRPAVGAGMGLGATVTLHGKRTVFGIYIQRYTITRAPVG